MQFNTGRHSRSWSKIICSQTLKRLPLKNKWKASLPEALIAATTRNGKMFAVPVNIHAITGFSNTRKRWPKSEPLNQRRGMKPSSFWKSSRAQGLFRWHFPRQELGKATVQLRARGQGRPHHLAGILGKRDVATVSGRTVSVLRQTRTRS